MLTKTRTVNLLTKTRIVNSLTMMTVNLLMKTRIVNSLTKTITVSLLMKRSNVNSPMIKMNVHSQTAKMENVYFPTREKNGHSDIYKDTDTGAPPNDDGCTMVPDIIDSAALAFIEDENQLDVVPLVTRYTKDTALELDETRWPATELKPSAEPNIDKLFAKLS